MILSTAEMTEGTYTFWQNEIQLAGSAGQMMGGFGGMQMPEGMEMPEGFDPSKKPENSEKPEPPEGMEMPEGMERPDGMTPPQGGFGGRGGKDQMNVELSKEFAITAEENYYSNVKEANE